MWFFYGRRAYTFLVFRESLLLLNHSSDKGKYSFSLVHSEFRSVDEYRKVVSSANRRATILALFGNNSSGCEVSCPDLNPNWYL